MVYVPFRFLLFGVRVGGDGLAASTISSIGYVAKEDTAMGMFRFAAARLVASSPEG